MLVNQGDNVLIESPTFSGTIEGVSTKLVGWSRNIWFPSTFLADQERDLHEIKQWENSGISRYRIPHRRLTYLLAVYTKRMQFSACCDGCGWNEAGEFAASAVPVEAWRRQESQVRHSSTTVHCTKWSQSNRNVPFRAKTQGDLPGQ